MSSLKIFCISLNIFKLRGWNLDCLMDSIGRLRLTKWSLVHIILFSPHFTLGHRGKAGLQNAFISFVVEREYVLQHDILQKSVADALCYSKSGGPRERTPVPLLTKRESNRILPCFSSKLHPAPTSAATHPPRVLQAGIKTTPLHKNRWISI